MENIQKEAKDCLLNIQSQENEVQFKPYHLLLQKVEKVEKNNKIRAHSAKLFNKKAFVSYRQESFNNYNDAKLNINNKQTLKNALQKLQEKSIEIVNQVTRRIKTSSNSISTSKGSSFIKSSQQKTIRQRSKKFIESNTYGIFSTIPNFDQKLKILFKNKKKTFQDQNEQIRQSIKRKLAEKLSKQKQKLKSTAIQTKIQKITTFLNQNKNNFFQTKRNKIYKAMSIIEQKDKEIFEKSNKQNVQVGKSYRRKQLQYKLASNTQRKLQKMNRYGSRKLTNILY